MTVSTTSRGHHQTAAYCFWIIVKLRGTRHSTTASQQGQRQMETKTGAETYPSRQPVPPSSCSSSNAGTTSCEVVLDPCLFLLPP